MTKKLTFAILFLVAFSLKGIAQEIKWVSMEEAMALQEKEPKKIIMDVYTVWCGPCKMLDKNTFGNADVIDYINTNYYAVKFNGEGNATVNYKDKTFGNPNYDPAKSNRRNSAHEFARFLRVNAYPTMVFFDEQANYITPVTGYLKPQQLELYLKLFKTDKHKEMKTQEQFNAYYKGFKPSFKE